MVALTGLTRLGLLGWAYLLGLLASALFGSFSRLFACTKVAVTAIRLPAFSARIRW